MAETSEKDMLGSIRFVKWQKLYEYEKPFMVFLDPPEDAQDQRTTNLTYEDHDIRFCDIRGKEADFTLDGQGFAVCQHDLDFADFEKSKAVEEVYLPEVERILKTEVDGADRIFIFDWRLRTSTPVKEGSVIDLNEPTDWLRPALHAHVDQSPSTVLNRILLQLPKEAETLLKGRVRMINVWRPLRNTIEDWPLGLCDGSSVRPETLVETDHVRRQFNGSSLNLLYDPGQKWYYLNQQRRNEVLLIKNFDSRSAVNSKYSPHASFKCADAPEGAAVRESIEVRAMVFSNPVRGTR